MGAGVVMMAVVLAGSAPGVASAAPARAVSGSLVYSRAQHQYMARIHLNGANRRAPHLIFQLTGLSGWKLGGVTEGAQTQPAGSCGSATTPVREIERTGTTAVWDMGSVSHLKRCTENIDLMPKGKHLHPFTITVYRNLDHGKLSSRYRMGTVHWSGKVTRVR